MLIEIKGVQFVNKGAELMLHAVIEQVRQQWPDAELVLEPNPLSAYSKRAVLGAYQKLSLRKNRLDMNRLAYRLPVKFRRVLKHKWGLVTEADIDLVLDASGFAYGDQWGALKIRHLASELTRYHKQGTKYVFLPQAMGPFSRAADSKYLRTALPKATLVCPREADSYRYVLNVMGFDVEPSSSGPENVMQFPDFTNLVQGIVPDYYVNGEQKVLIIPNSNMVGAKNSHQPAWREHYLQVLVNAVSVIREMGLAPVLLNHEGQGDGDLCREVQAAVGGDTIEYIEEAHPLKVKGIIGASRAIICSRFHGCVSALAQGTPCLGTSWSHKYERLFDEYQRAEFLLQPLVTKTELHELLERCIAEQDAQAYQNAIGQYKQLAQNMWQTVFTRVGQ